MVALPQVVDPTVQVALIGIVVTLITTSGIVIVALINNRKERTGSADAGVDKAYAERLKAKDDIIAAKDATISFKDEQLADCRQDLVAKDLLLHAKDEEIARLKDALENQETAR